MSRTPDETSHVCNEQPGMRHSSHSRRLRWLHSLTFLALLTACAGEVQKLETDSDEDSAEEERDAGKADAGRRDARVDARASNADDDDDEGDDDVEKPDARVVQPNERGDGGRDAGRDSGRDATGGDAPTDAGGDKGDGATTPAPTGPSTCPNGQTRAPAKGLKIRDIALYQTVKVNLLSGGTWAATPSVPVVAGKKALVRVFVDTVSGYSPHAVRGSITLQTDGKTTEVADEKTISAASTDADLGTTFSFQVDGALIGPTTQVTFALEEPACGQGGSADATTRFPATGSQALGATAIGKLRVVIVPISVQGRLPVTTEAEVKAIKDAMLAYYPVPDVEVTVRDRPITWSSTLSGTDNAGWTNILNQVMRERSSDRVDTDVYYFGLMQPAASMQTYCSRGCILGLAPQTVRVQSSAQVGLGASFANAQTYETIVHEIGHAHGRGHAPCAPGNQIQGVDRSFPERTGSIMTWGWDSRTNKLYDPMRTKDVMGYCSPNWISPYTYGALATRGLAVNKKAFVFNADLSTRWTDVLLYSDGSTRWGGMTETELPGGETEPARALDASGAVLEEIEVARVTLSHSDDQILYLPAPGAKWSAIALKDRVLQLSSIQPAL